MAFKIGSFRLWSGGAQLPDREQVEQAGRMVMQHIGLTGQCSCLQTRDAANGQGYLLTLKTMERVPATIRQDMAQYFSRKIKEMLQLDPSRLVVVLVDARDIVRQQTEPPASSALMHALVQQAKMHDQQVSEVVSRMREEAQEGREKRRRMREQRARDSGAAPLAVPATDWSDLPPIPTRQG